MRNNTGMREAFRLAYEADISLSSARKALLQGPQALHGRTREKATEAMKRLGMSSTSLPPPSPEGR